MSTPRKATVLALGFALFAWLGIVDAAPPTANCYSVRLQVSPTWVSSALAREKYPPLIVVDAARSRLLAYGPMGDSAIIQTPKLKASTGFLPNAINKIDGDEILLELTDGSLVQLDKNFLVTKEFSSPQAKQTDKLRLGSLYQWKVAGDSIVAYGSLLNESDEVIWGFFRIPLGGTQQTPEMLNLLQDSAFYLIGNNYITTIGTTAYYVTMDRFPAIFRVSPGEKPVKLSSFTGDFRERPTFTTKMNGPRSAAAHFAELERFTVPAGLYSQDGFLYLLTRKPASGETTWYLYKIDPSNGRFSSSEGVRLPTSAHHLTVAVSRTEWFLIQRGPVREMQQQDIDSMVVIDGSEISSLAKFPTSCPEKPRFAQRKSLVTKFFDWFAGLM